MFKRLLLPVDGTQGSASIVPYAAELASRFECWVDVLLVEPESNARLPHPDHHRPQPKSNSGESGQIVVGTSTPKHIREANQRYVNRHVEEFEALGVTAQGQVVCGDPVEEILKAALDLRCDAIAMTTRKMSNYSRKSSGSISEEILWRSKLPVLLIANG